MLNFSGQIGGAVFFFFFISRRGILFARVMDVPGVGVRDDCAFKPKTTDLPSALRSLHLEDESAKSKREVPQIPSIHTHTHTHSPKLSEFFLY